MAVPGLAQIDSIIAQISDSPAETYAGGISGDGRFIVFESFGNLATVNPRNEDGNNEIFLFDYAQRQIFQLTDTKSVLFNTAIPGFFSNVRIAIVNTRPVISRDGRWIAFSSNATTSTPSAPDATNPGSFDGNAFTAPTPTPSPTPTPTGSPSPTPTGSPTPTPTPPANPLSQDANLEMWLYEIPAYTPVSDLSAGEEIPFSDLSAGNFIRVTNTFPSQLPRAGTASTGPYVADDNHDASISDDGNVIAFASTRDLVTGGNSFPTEDNDEIFTFVRSLGLISQVTQTPRGPISNPIYNKNPTISGNGQRVVFASTGDNPIIGMTGGNNPLSSRNEEIFYSDLNSQGAPTGTRKQVTVTTPTNPGDVVNILDLGRRMSRDGRYIAFDSYADLANENSGTNYTSFATYLFDTTDNSFRRILARSDADADATGGDIARYPGFTDYSMSGAPETLVLETRMNIKPDGTVATTTSDGLNPSVFRQAQVYTYPLDEPAQTARFKRIGNFPVPGGILVSVQLIPSDSSKRMTFNMGFTEFGTGNSDGQPEVYYLLTPNFEREAPVVTSLATGASRMPIDQAPVPSPTPTPSPSPTPTGTPSPTPTPSPAATPTPSPSPSPTASPTGTPTPTPTPQTPPSVPGISSGMLTIMNFQAGDDRPIIARQAIGSLERRPTLPFELSGVSVTINGVSCGLKSVSQRRIEFVAPEGLSNTAQGTIYPLVIYNNGTVMRDWIRVVPGQPDIFNRESLIGPGGRTKMFNVTNTVWRTEPFVIRTVKVKGNKLVPSRLRVYATGIARAAPPFIFIRIGDVTVAGTQIVTAATLIEPGVYALDFDIPESLAGAGDKPVVITINVDGVNFSSRLDDTASRTFIL